MEARPTVLTEGRPTPILDHRATTTAAGPVNQAGEDRSLTQGGPPPGCRQRPACRRSCDDGPDQVEPPVGAGRRSPGRAGDAPRRPGAAAPAAATAHPRPRPG